MDLLTGMEVFVRTVDKGSLSAAADACAISATMAGKHLRALEARVGTKLLNRTTRRHSLTEFGMSYYVQCQEILRLVAQTDTQAQNHQSTPRGTLRITAPVSFGSEALVPALSEYLRRHPQVRVDLRLHDRNVDLVEEGFDAAIRVGKLPDSSLVARPLAPYRMMVCASPDYLARHGVPASPDELQAHDCLAFSHAGHAPWHFRDAARDVRVAVDGRLTVNHGQALRVAALHGLGIVMQPAALLRAEVQAGRLVQLFADDQLPGRPMHVVYQRNQRSPKLRSFVDFVLDTFG